MVHKDAKKLGEGGRKGSGLGGGFAIIETKRDSFSYLPKVQDEEGYCRLLYRYIKKKNIAICMPRQPSRCYGYTVEVVDQI